RSASAGGAAAACLRRVSPAPSWGRVSRSPSPMSEAWSKPLMSDFAGFGYPQRLVRSPSDGADVGGYRTTVFVPFRQKMDHHHRIARDRRGPAIGGAGNPVGIEQPDRHRSQPAGLPFGEKNYRCTKVGQLIRLDAGEQVTPPGRTANVAKT